MVAKQKQADDDAQAGARVRSGSVAAVASTTHSIPDSIRRLLGPDVAAEDVEEILAFAPGSVDALADWTKRYLSRPEVSSVEVRIDRSNPDPVVVPTAYTTVPGRDYIDYLTRETRWWLETYDLPVDVIRPAIW